MKKWTFLCGVLVSIGMINSIYADNALQYFQNKVAVQQLPEADLAFKTKDYQKAFALYKHLADEGQAVAEYQVAYMYQNGLGVEKNLPLAVAWYMKASSLQLPQAQFALATLYYYGVGIEQGLTQAITLYTQA